MKTSTKTVHVIAAVYSDKDHAKDALDLLEQMHRAVTITMLDAALVSKNERGLVHMKETKELTIGKGAGQGAIAGVVFGLIYPPSVIDTAIAGGLIGAMTGGARDTGINRSRLTEVAAGLEPGKAAVIVLADDDSVLAIQQALANSGGSLVTEPLDQEALKRLYEAETLGVVPPTATQLGPTEAGDQGTPLERLERVRQGMTVVDAAGEPIGNVASIKFGDPGATTAGAVDAGEELEATIVVALGGHREPDAPADLADRLLRSGYIKIDDKRPLRPTHHYYAAADEIASVVGESVRLTRHRGELIAAGH